MEVRVLGPLRVAGATTSTELRGRRERAVLAALALGAGDVVATDRLIAALWGEHAPRSAAKNVQNCVLRLRKALGPDVIETQVPGYRLAVPADAVDARRFEDLVALGRAARVNGTPDRAAAAFREALGLWRGEPFDDLRGWDPADAEAARLVELRRIAAEELMDAELTCGRHAACVAELERMAGEEPFRERRWAMLMLALYRCGRQAEALRAYQRARIALATELGIEPGPELRTLERAVVAQDGSLDLPAAADASGPAVEPAPVGGGGIVFVLFSDVVASTEVLDRLGDEAADALRRAHFRVLRDAVATHRGREVKSVGDGLMVAFTSGADAVGGALAMQRAVGESNRHAPEPLQVRIGLHVGEPLRDEDDLFGTAVVVARRLCDAAAPDQIVASELVRELVGPRRRFAFADAGSIAVKGLGEPVPAVEVLGEATDTVVEPSRAVEPPYKGLVPFEPGDAGLFFGRDEMVAALVERLASARLLAVVGASGSGKSSLVRAGLVAALGDDVLAGSASWPVVLMSPGPHPLAELAAHLSRHAGVPASSLLDELGGDARALDLAARQAAAPLPSGTRVVVVVDQFEELFTLCRDEHERRRFVDALVNAASVSGGIATVVLAIRADFYGHCAAFPELAHLVEAGTTLVTPMSREDMAAVVEGPAGVAGLRLEPGLAEVALRDLADEPGALPLLSHALLETWKRRRGRMLTHGGYNDAGGVRGAIARTAEAVYGGLDPARQALARNVFVRLTELGEGTEDTRRRVAVAELSAGPDDAEAVASVLRTLTDARLVTVSDAGVELAHEALIREWPRLRGWLDDDREGLRIHRHLTHAAQDWSGLGRDPAELYRGPRLAAAAEWVDRAGDGALNPLERGFLAASRARQQQEEREREGHVRRLRQLLAGVAVALVIALVAGSLAVVQRRRADDQAATARDATLRADVGRLVAESDSISGRDRHLSTLLALEANRLADTAATRGALLSALADEPRLHSAMFAGHEGYSGALVVPPGRLFAARGPDAVDFFDTRTGRPSGPPIETAFGAGFAASPDGTLVATGTRDGTVTMWDVATREQSGARITLASGSRALAFSHDGRRLLTTEGGRGITDTSPEAREESTIRVWDVATRSPLGGPLGGHTAPVNAAAYSGDGRFLATGGTDNTVVLRDAETGDALRPPLSTGAGVVVSLEFSPDSSRLAVSTYLGGGLIFDVTTGEQVKAFPSGLFDPALRVRFSPDGNRIATLLDTVQVWDAATFAPEGSPIDPELGYFEGAFSADSGMLALAGTSGMVSLWDLDGRPRIAEPIPGSTRWGGVFSPDGTVIAVPGRDHVTLYDAATLTPTGPPLPVEPITDIDAPARLAFSPDGEILAISGGAGRIHRYGVATLEPVGEPVDVDGPPVSLAFSPDGRILAAGSAQDAVTLVDARTGTPDAARRLGYSGPVAVAFSPDGRRLVATVSSGNAEVFDLTEDRVTARPVSNYRNQITIVAFSPDGRVLVTGDHTGNLQFRDPETFAPVGAPVAGTGNYVTRIAFSPDGRLVVAGDFGGTTRLVDVETRRLMSERFTATFGDYVSFTPDGTRMATSSADATLVWDLDVAVWRERACDIAGRNLTEAERGEYLPNDPDAPPTCPAFADVPDG